MRYIFDTITGTHKIETRATVYNLMDLFQGCIDTNIYPYNILYIEKYIILYFGLEYTKTKMKFLIEHIESKKKG